MTAQSQLSKITEILKKDLFVNLNKKLDDFIAENHFNDDLEDPQSAFIDNWKYDFDYMSKNYPNLFSCPEDEPEIFELERRLVMEWANG